MKNHVEAFDADVNSLSIVIKTATPFDYASRNGSADMLNYLSEYERITVAEAESLTQTPRSTLKLRLKSLQEKGLIERHGKARGTWYVLA